MGNDARITAHMPRLPVFITGNQYKADYLAKTLGIKLDHQKVDLDEIQSRNLDEIAVHKVKQAYDIIKKPVLVEDISLGFTVLGGLPGPFIRFFVDSPDGLEKLCQMLDGFNDRSARAECTYGYFDGEQVEVFRAGMNGTIAASLRGTNGFGWDRIFEPVGYAGKTRAELTAADDETTYAALRPYQQLRDFLQSGQ